MRKYYHYYTPKAYVCLFMCLTILCVPRFPFVVSNPMDQISTCLTLENVGNFTTYNAISSLNFFKMLNSSIQNLRYADPTLPKPTAIIMPESLDQLRSAILCSRKAHCRIMTRSGGHSYEGTSYVGPPPFVVLDLSNLDRITPDAESQTAWVEAGATLGQTYLAISRETCHGFSAGSCPTVGTGGHISGGGFGLLSRKYGLAADNVLDAVLVDAEGRVLSRRDMGEDVFWAIRGGGGGVWGVVYAWKIKLLQVPPVVTAFAVPNPGHTSDVAGLVDKWQRVAHYLPDEFYLSCFVGAGLPGSKKGHSGLLSTKFKGLYLGPKARAVDIIAEFFPELASVVEQESKEMTWIESVVFFSGLAPGTEVSELGNRYLQNKNYFKAKSDFVRSLIPKAGIEALLSQLSKEPKGYVILDPYGGIMDCISSEAIAFPHRKGNLYSIQYLIEWQQNEDYFDERNKNMDWIRTLYDAMAPYVSSSPRAAYINYMDFDLGVSNELDNASSNDAVDIARVWGHKYFLNNFDRLVRAKTLIDPLNVFSNPQAIPPIPNFNPHSSV